MWDLHFMKKEDMAMLIKKMLETAERAISSDFKRPRAWIDINQAGMQFIIVKLADPVSCTLRKFYWLIDFIVMFFFFHLWNCDEVITDWYIIHGLVNMADLVT